jgi:DNA-binding GntR family transcriptional regulator
MKPVSRDSLTSKAYQRIRTALMLSQLQPGERLVLRPLAAELGISPTPVREALLRLVSEHALEIDQRGVVSVPLFDPEAYREIRDLRIDLESQAAAAALAHIGDRDIAELEKLHRQYAEIERRGDARAALEINEKLHMRLYAVARRPVLQSLIESLWMRCAPFFTRLHGRGITRYPNRHDLIIDGLKKGDARLVRQGVRDDIMAGWNRMMAEASQE